MEKEGIFLDNPSTPQHQCWGLPSARAQAEVLTPPNGSMKLFKISLELGRVVKFKKLFDFFIGDFYNSKREMK
jgi:hypothetical protein